MKVVLFCGGLGTRLQEHSGGLPKPMVNIGSKPILWHIMKYYAHFGHKEFVLCLGYKADVIRNFFLNYDQYLSGDITIANGSRQMHRQESDIADWSITLADTGLKSNIGQRLKAVEKYIGEDEMFLANYADGLTDLPLPDMIDFFKKSGKIASFICAKPSQSFHVVSMKNGNLIDKIQYVQETELMINAGYFIFRREIFQSIRDGEELVMEPFQRLIAQDQLIGYKYERFWCMDTSKEQQELNDMYERNNAPWAVWNHN